MSTRHSTSSSPGAGATVIGPGIRVSGRVEGKEDLRVEGRVDGSISLSERLLVAEGGIVVADVTAREIVVAGIVVGDLQAIECVTLHAGARVVGDVAAPRLVLEDGAALRGRVAMGEGGAATLRARGTAARRPMPTRAPVRAARPRPVQLEDDDARDDVAITEARSAPPRAARPAEPPEVEPEAALAEPEPEPEPIDDVEAPARGPWGVAAGPRSDGAAPPRVVAPLRRFVAVDDDEVTVVVRHAEVDTPARRRAGARDEEPVAAAEKPTTTPPRARIPKPGKRRISRR